MEIYLKVAVRIVTKSLAKEAKYAFWCNGTRLIIQFNLVREIANVIQAHDFYGER